MKRVVAVYVWICVAVASRIIAKTNGQLGCYDQSINHVIANGEVFVRGANSCESCQCRNGQLSCEEIQCPPVACIDALLLPEVCCPVCPGGEKFIGSSISNPSPISPGPLPLPSHGISVTCTADLMTVYVKQSTAVGQSPDDLTLNDATCTAQRQGDAFVLSTKLTSCGTVAVDLADSLAFKNRVRSREPPNGVGGKPSLDLQVTCIFAKEQKGEASISIQSSSPSHDLTSSVMMKGQFNTRLELLDSELNAVSSAVEVLPVTLGSRVHFRVTAANLAGSSLQLNARRCYVSTQDATKTYDLIDNGCIVEPSTLREGGSNVGHNEVYSFETFTFIGERSSALYLRCDTIVCVASAVRCLGECPVNMEF